MSSPTVERVLVRLPELSLAESGKAVAELREFILDGQPDGALLQVDRHKESDETQDFGATLVVVFGTPAAIALAQGIRRWIEKRGSRVVIETAGGSVVATGDGATNIDVAATVKALAGT